GIDIHEDDVRVVNGIRRGEEFQPLLIRPVGDEPNLAGFELAPPLEMESCFTENQMVYWEQLPDAFKFEEAAQTVPKGSLSRLIKRARSLGLLERTLDGRFRK